MRHFQFSQKSMPLKCQFHSHCSGDAIDNINYSAKTLIKQAAKLNYTVLSITCHRKLLFSKGLQKYAKKKGILLIPGIEFEIDKKHILGINVDKKIMKVDTFAKLSKYKKSHPDCLIIAPHPFFPTRHCLKKILIKNIHLFDAIEISWAYTKTKNYNKKAIEVAKYFNKPIVATSDCHILNYLDAGYIHLDSKKNPKSIIKAIRNNKIEIHSKPTSYFKIARFFTQIVLQKILRRN